MNFRFLLFAAVALLSAVGWGTPFGRFGYSDRVRCSGFEISHEAFRVADPLADEFRFDGGLSKWTVATVSNTQQTVETGGGPGLPSKIRVDLFSPGFWLFYDQGIRLRVAATAAPYLSWNEGSVGKDVPTPDARWVVVSFQTLQAPVVIGFPDSPCSLKVTGRPANWVISSPEKYQGWIHVGLPMGIKKISANSAASLGSLAETLRHQESLYAEPAPFVKSLEVQEDRQSVTATWQFDRPGAVIPPAALLSGIGDYPITIQSPTTAIDAPTLDGPLAVCSGKSLTIRFPVRRIPTGRAVAIGAGRLDPIGTVSPEDIPSVFDLAIENLLATRDTQTRKASEDVLAEFLASASLTVEPFTKQQLPYGVDGSGADLVAAHALLMQALTSTRTATSEANSLLTSLTWRTDWSTWLIAVDDPEVSRRAGAIASLAAALCPEPERRLAAGQWQAGLAGQRGLGLWRRRNGMIRETPVRLEAALGIRQGIFGLRDHPVEGRGFADVLASPIRAYGDLPVFFSGSASPFVLGWNAVEAKSTVLTLAAPYPLKVEAKTNLDRLKVGQGLGLTELRMIPTIAGLVEVTIAIPSWASPPPSLQSRLGYSEVKR